MDILSLLTRHDHIERHKIVDELLLALQKHYPISFFQYDCIFSDTHEHVTLSSRRDWLEHYLTNRFYEHSYFQSQLSRLTSKLIKWDDIGEQSEFISHCSREHFNMDNGFCVIMCEHSKVEHFHFAGEKGEDSIQELCSNKIDLLYRFIQYFICKINELNLVEEAPKYCYPDNNAYDQELSIKSLSDLSLPLSKNGSSAESVVKVALRMV